jgi:DNA repair photolyase
MRIIYTPKDRADEYARQRDYPQDKPLAVNLFSGCTNGCKYCYVPAVLRQTPEDFHRKVTLKKNALTRFQKDCEQLRDEGNRAPIFMSFTCDPLPINDPGRPDSIKNGHQCTGAAIEIAHHYGQRVNILTKSSYDLCKYAIDLLKPGDIFGVTLTCSNEERAQYWEPFAEYPQERIRALQYAHSQDIETRVSFEPVLYPTETLHLIEQVRPFTTLIQVGKLNLQRTHGPELRERHDAINWARFALRVKETLDALGGRYYIKRDLAQYLKG